jgi:hypothetical protein
LEQVQLERHHRRIFIWFVIITLFALSIVRILLYENSVGPNPILVVRPIMSLVDALIAGVCLSVIAGLVIRYFSPAVTFESEMKIVAASEIAVEMNAALDKATTWYFLGNRGRYLRAVVIPRLASKTGLKNVQAIFCDPFDDVLSESFCSYKRQDPKDDEELEWSVTRIQSEILASIIVGAWYNKQNNMSIEIYLSSFYSPIRLDSNTHVSYLLVENKRQPGIVVSENHVLHKWLLDDFLVKRTQCKKLILPNLEVENLEKVEAHEVASFIENICDLDFSEDLVFATTELVRNNPNPFPH